MRPSTPDLKETFFLKETKEKGVKMSDIGIWAHEYNKMNTKKIRIRGKLVRYTIPDVMTVYMGIGGEANEDVVVETIRVFGPREQVSEIY
jgi:tryptophanase